MWKFLFKLFLVITLPLWCFPYMMWTTVEEMIEEWERKRRNR